MKHTLATAAKACGISKSTVYRAVKSGKLSASRDENGEYEIDPAELHRVYAPVQEHAVNQSEAQPETADDAMMEWLRELVDRQQKTIDRQAYELREAEERAERREQIWLTQLDRITNLLPAPEQEKKGWFRLFRSAG